MDSSVAVVQKSPPPPPPQERNNFIQAMIMALLLVVSAGYIFLWIMLPTNLYRRTWLPEIQAQANSTYFENQGN